MLGGRSNLCGRGSDFVGGALLFLGRRRNFRCGRVDLDARTLDLADQFRQVVRQAVKAAAQEGEFVAPLQGEAPGEVALAHAFEGRRQTIQRLSNRGGMDTADDWDGQQDDDDGGKSNQGELLPAQALGIPHPLDFKRQVSEQLDALLANVRIILVVEHDRAGRVSRRRVQHLPVEVAERSRGELTQAAHRAHQVGVLTELGPDELQSRRQVGFRLALAPFLGYVLGIQQQAAHGVAKENDIAGDTVLGA